jgi:ankyrin repeat protein
MNRNDIKGYSQSVTANVESYVLQNELCGIVRQLVARGVTFDTIGVDGRSALHHVVSNKSLKFIEFLFELGLNFSVLDNEGCNCLFLALEAGRFDLSIFLINKGHTVQAPNFRAFRLLKRRFDEDNKDVFKSLLKFGLNDLKEYRDVDGSNLALLVIS